LPAAAALAEKPWWPKRWSSAEGLRGAHDADPLLVSVDRIRHNIAQGCQERTVIAEQNNICVPA
jgi:hypothetical protein